MSKKGSHEPNSDCCNILSNLKKKFAQTKIVLMKNPILKSSSPCHGSRTHIMTILDEPRSDTMLKSTRGGVNGGSGSKRHSNAELKILPMKYFKKEVEEMESITHEHKDFYTGSRLLQRPTPVP